MTDTQQLGRDGKSDQQESFEDYSDHDLILYTAEVGMIHQAHQTAIAYSAFVTLKAWANSSPGFALKPWGYEDAK